ncbi:MAG TPA: iron-sulfur cluster carrier protein ApbC [Salinisphaeraceae bacterium]|nr:iron-sulfur cluster carrier protein ApbC [Salinisphaeraceae bacterium]
MSISLQERIETLVNDYHDAMLGATLSKARAVQSVQVAEGKAAVKIQLGFPAKSHGPQLAAALRQAIKALDGVTQARVDVSTNIIAHSSRPGIKRIDAIKNIIAVASGKGGVGKSTVAANLALALAAEGAAVGMLDADIYGPSQPRMLGVKGRPSSDDGRQLAPMKSYSVQSMSVGYMIEEDEPTVWRGPMVTQALTQLLNDTRWDALDYLIVDMPPGTGDIQLTLSQNVPVSGAVIVTTPQDIATLDARKGLQMFRKVNVPILGLIENMSLQLCPHCGHESHPFGAGGGRAVAEQYNVPLLGELPLDESIRAAADGGRPSVVADPDGPVAQRFSDIALRMTAKLSLQGRHHGRRFPKIVVETT